MNNRNVFFSLGSYAREYMASSIQKFGLVEGDAPGGLMTLSNANCIIFLENVENNYVGFDFASKAIPEVKFDLGFYLDAEVEGGSRKHCPHSPREWKDEAKFIYFLKAFDTLLMAGVLDAPLAGDFSWEPSFRGFVAEFKRLDSILTGFSRVKHPESRSIRQKRDLFDLTWMDDVRRILSEQESKS